MADQNGEKYGFTGLFPIARGKTTELRKYLRSLDDTGAYPGGSPFIHVPIIHMARLFIIDRLAYQGTPAKADTLQSDYLVFLCDFDGDSVDGLVTALLNGMPNEAESIWSRCVGFPGIDRHDRFGEYFGRCRITTTLFFVDQPKATVGEILKGLICRRRLGEFIKQVQGGPRDPVALKQGFEDMWRSLQQDSPAPGEL
jgi:hypothetical protein